jgi:DNA mismatch repair ATPase MutS
MYSDRDFGPEKYPPNAADLTQDLELDTLLAAMAAGDTFLLEVAKDAVLQSLDDPDEILYRQHILADCLERSDIVREMYRIAVEAGERERKVWGWMSVRYPEGTLRRSIEVLKIFVGLLKRLRQTADQHGGKFWSEGFRRLFDMLAKELNEEYLWSVEDHLERLEFRNGILMSAELVEGNRGTNYILRKAPDARQSWIERFQGWLEQVTRSNGSNYVYEIADRDEAGFRALSELRSQGISHVAAALAQSTEHILSFFSMLRLELGFYVGCLNLRDQLARKNEPISLPEPLVAGKPTLSGQGLYDPCLSLNMGERAVGNDVSGDDKMLVMITGANQGGKSTFLRSIGLAQLMMQCGMFVAAESFRTNVCRGIFTHFKREEDASMRSGKLDEELSRMSSMVDTMTPNSIVLLNESFASTNEREGSEIARQIVRALLETGVKVFYVTHMFDLAQGFYLAKMDVALFLRAERLADGRRTFRLVEGEPLPTSYGEDLYGRIFGAVRDATTAAPPSDVRPGRS